MGTMEGGVHNGYSGGGFTMSALEGGSQWVLWRGGFTMGTLDGGERLRLVSPGSKYDP